MQNQKEYSDEDIIKALKKCYSLNGNKISLALYTSTIKYPSPELIRRRFGSWNEALNKAGLPIYRKRKHREVVDRNFEYSKEHIIEQLRHCFNTHGQLTGTFYDKKGYVPCSRTISLQFGSWKAAIEASGIPIETGNNNQFTEEEVLEQLMSFYKANNHSISKRSYTASGRLPKVDTIRKYFGTWNKALEKAGIPTKKPKVKNNFTREEILQIIMDVYNSNGENISKNIYKEMKNQPSLDAIEMKFGSWSEALVQAGIKAERPNTAKKYTKEMILLILRQFYDLNGHISIDFYEESGQKPHPTTIIKRFGSWGNALREAGLVFEDTEIIYTKEDIIAEIKRCYKENGNTINSSLYLYGDYKPVLTTINKVFGSWNNAVEAAGLS